MLLGIPLLGIVLAAPEYTFVLLARTAVFCLATVLCMFHAYAFNDWSNFSFDLNDPHKQDAPLLRRLFSLNEALSFSALTFLVGVVLYLVFLPLITFFICLAMMGLCILYSNRFTLLKNVPIISTFIHLISGPLLFNLGWSLVAPCSPRSFAAGLFFGILYSAGHLSHESIDYEGDLAAGLRTTPVVFGRRPVFMASALGVTLATAWLIGAWLQGLVFPASLAAIFFLSWLCYLAAFHRAWRTDLSHRHLAEFRTAYRRIYSLAGLTALATALLFPVSRSLISPRVTLLGIDALDWEMVCRLGEEGKLPTLTRLRRQGVSGPLLSIKPMISPALWTTMVTGKTRQEHGITDFTARDEAGRRVPATVNQRRVKAIWNILSERGLRVGFVNWWPSYPAEEVNGFMVSNYLRYLYPTLAEDGKMEPGELEGLSGLSWPPELGASLLEGFNAAGGFLQEIDLEAIREVGFAGGYDPVFRQNFQDGYEVFRYAVLGDEGALEVSRDLLGSYRLDLFGVYLEGIDILSHLFWGYREPERYGTDPQAARILGDLLERYYVYLDRRLGDLVSELSREDYLIIVSDHGYGGVGEKKHFHVPRGTIIMTGPGLVPGLELSGATVLDITPTILELLGLPVAEDMSGRPLREAFLPGSLVPPRRIPTYETGVPVGSGSRPDEGIGSPVDDKVLKRLRTLGYIN